MKLAVQLDFDSTITEEDVSFFLLDHYAGDAWRVHLKEYTGGKITVAEFNRRVFSMVKAGREDMTDLVLSSDRVKVRPGFRELIDFCRVKGLRVVIVSNGLDFYIRAILNILGLQGIEVHAAESEFFPDGIKVRYIGPEGLEVESGFKEAYTRQLVKEGYDVVYVGDGSSDFLPCQEARYVFATGSLLKRCREKDVEYVPFTDFFEVIRGLQRILPD